MYPFQFLMLKITAIRRGRILQHSYRLKCSKIPRVGVSFHYSFFFFLQGGGVVIKLQNECKAVIPMYN